MFLGGHTVYVLWWSQAFCSFSACVEASDTPQAQILCYHSELERLTTCTACVVSAMLTYYSAHLFDLFIDQFI